MSNIYDLNPDNTAMGLKATAYPKADGVDERSMLAMNPSSLRTLTPGPFPWPARIPFP